MAIKCFKIPGTDDLHITSGETATYSSLREATAHVGCDRKRSNICCNVNYTYTVIKRVRPLTQ